MIKKEIFLQKMFVWIKDDRDSVTRKKNLQKRKLDLRLEMVFLLSLFLKVYWYALSNGWSYIFEHNMSFHNFVSCIMQDIKWNT